MLTGYSGFTGPRIARALADVGFVVIAAGRSPPADAGYFADWRVIDDINRTTDWTSALRDCEIVVHAAGYAHASSRSIESRRLIREINVEGTRELARQAAAAGVRRFVYLSSIKVFGECSGERPYDLGTPLDPQHAYGIAKLEAERAIADICRATQMECALIRPPMIIGPGAKANLAKLIRLVRTGAPLPLASIRNERSVLGIDNLAHLIAIAATHARACEHPLLPADNCAPSTPTLLGWIAHALGRKSRLVHCPPVLLEAAATLLGQREMMTRLTRSQAQDWHATGQLLDWRPQVEPEASIAAAVRSMP